MNTKTRPSSTLALAAALAAAGEGGSGAAPPAEPRYAAGARVKISGSDSAGEVQSGQVTDVYDVLVDGEDKPRRCLGDEIEPEAAPAAGGGNGAAQQRAALPRPFALFLVKASGLRPGASDAATQAKAVEMLGGASWLLEATGAKTMAEAQGIASAWKRSHETLPGVTAERDKLVAQGEQAERMSTLEAGIVAGVWTPGKAWKDGDKAKGLSDWAQPPHQTADGKAVGQTLEQLKADLAASSALSFAGPPAKPAATATTLLTEEEQAAAKRAAATNEEWEAARASVLAGELPKIGRKGTR